MPHDICVCICTYKRPQMLASLLRSLPRLLTGNCIRLSVVVADNDHEESAKPTVSAFQSSSDVPVTYIVEPVRNIALARNKAVANADGDFLAFIDDDEVPGDEWLIRLYDTLIACRADGVLGPVVPRFESPPPRWVTRGRLFERRAFPTGTGLAAPRDMRTGNVLLSASLFRGRAQPFDPYFGLTGGEDTDFFARALRDGRVFVWCNEAPVFETVPPSRTKRAYLLKRALLRGATAADRGERGLMTVAKSCWAFLLYAAALPVLLVMGHHLFMRYLISDCDHIGKLLAVCGIRPFKERSF